MHVIVGRVGVLISILAMTNFAVAQQQVTIDVLDQHQTMHGFGASDAWNCDFVGQYWDVTQREQIAEWLFSMELTPNGQPEGIGLSRWRFNIGGGSTEQGGASNIEKEERRAECFLNQNGTYDWSKQAGQQWFLNKAHEYGVHQLVAFVNSPPRYYTNNGRTNSDNQDRSGPTNLKSDHYDEFATFLATVLAHFEDEGTPFAQLSPVNEPQYEWNSGQEGCPWTNTEIKSLIHELDAALVNEGLQTKILLSEAASYEYLHKVHETANKSDQIWRFFNSANSEYLGGYTSLLPGIGAHSYWTNNSDAEIRSVRENVWREAQEQGLSEVYQTEYNLLDQYFGDKTQNAIFLAKIMYADLAIANVSIWDYWTAIERERWSQNNRFFLIRLHPNGGDYNDLTSGGTVSADKNLWAMGQFSRFIRPGYVRVGVTGADDLNGLMGAAFMSPEGDELVTVYVNWSQNQQSIQTQFNNLVGDYTGENIMTYKTDASGDLSPVDLSTGDFTYNIPGRSVVTMVMPIEQLSVGVHAATKLQVQSNGHSNVFSVNGLESAPLMIRDMSGRIVARKMSFGTSATINLSSLTPGVYLICQGVKSERIVVH